MLIGGIDLDVWLVDTEFRALPGERPEPICLVAHRPASGCTIRLWGDDLTPQNLSFLGKPDTLLVAYYASAEVGSLRALGLPPPARVLDLFVEFRNLTNGSPNAERAGIIDALVYFGLPSMSYMVKEAGRQLVMQGGPFTPGERSAILDYCEQDVTGLALLLGRILPLIDLPRAVLRGRFMIAAADIEHRGVPIDVNALTILRREWLNIQGRLVEAVDPHHEAFDGKAFRYDRWAGWLERRGIAWPRLESGRLALDDDTFREMARANHQVRPIRELRVSLSQMRLENLAVGADGRNRCLLSAFRAKTGRNQPSNTKSIFGPSVWLRGLIRPEPGYGLAYVDYSSQELGIAAALSGDAALQAAYRSGDPYIAFARQARAVPATATRQSHPEIREQFKVCALATLYGMGPRALAMRIGQPEALARELLQLHRETYGTFWRWSQGCLDFAALHNFIHTVFGWTLHLGSKPSWPSLANFPMQANGAEMLRLACCLATESGIEVCAPVHDALLVEAPLPLLDDVVAATQAAMVEASEVVLAGFELRTDAKLVKYPDRYMDPRGAGFWRLVWETIAQGPADDAKDEVPEIGLLINREEEVPF